MEILSNKSSWSSSFSMKPAVCLIFALIFLLLSCSSFMLKEGAAFASSMEDETEMADYEDAVAASGDSALGLQADPLTGDNTAPVSASILNGEGMSLLPDGAEDELLLLNREEIFSLLETVLILVRSEEFQALMAYQDVRELLLMALEKSVSLASEDPVLVLKILETAGVDEKQIYLLMLLLENRETLSPLLKEVRESETAREIITAIEENYDSEEINIILAELCLELENAKKQ